MLVSLVELIQWIRPLDEPILCNNLLAHFFSQIHAELSSKEAYNVLTALYLVRADRVSGSVYLSANLLATFLTKLKPEFCPLISAFGLD